MFDVVAGTRIMEPRRPLLPVVVTTTAHLFIVGAFIVVPLLYVTEQLPEVPTMLAFVAAAPSPPPPSPPPVRPLVQPAKASPPSPAASDRMVAPIDVPEQIEPETGGEDQFDGGSFDGVEGGVPGGVVGGIVGGLPDVPPPPPPPPPPAPRKVVRIGGQLQAPDLVKRVEPEYPGFAVSAGIQGVVILEATVDESGEVIDVKVLRSLPLLDRAAVAAVRQWRYSPLRLNGIPTRFVLTVSLSFHLQTRK